MNQAIVVNMQRFVVIPVRINPKIINLFSFDTL